MIVFTALRIAAAAAAAASLTACGAVSPTPVSSPRGTVSASAASTASPPVSASSGQGPAGLRSVHDPGQVTGTLRGPCHARSDGQLPDPACTPGAVDPAVTQRNIGSTICRAGYTATVRPPESQTERFKFDEAYPAYGVPAGTRTELDHLVSLELGGSNAASNLWPEVPPTPNPKDDVENALHRAVCSGQVTLAAAQRAIAADWMTAESKLAVG